MRLTIICGSQRTGSQSLTLAEQLAEQLAQNPAITKCDVISVSQTEIPLWDEDFSAGSEAWTKAYGPAEDSIAASDGIIVCVPEYGGMVPPVLKNLFLLDRKRIFAHKAGLIVSISEGLGGTYPVAELRMSSFKNTKICWIPDHLIVRRVSQLTEATEQAKSHAKPLPRPWERINHTVDVFLAYVRALSGLRAEASVDLDLYQNGM